MCMWAYPWYKYGVCGVINFDNDGNFHAEETQINSPGAKGEHWTPESLGEEEWLKLKRYLVNYANEIIDEEGWGTPHLTMDDLVHPEEV